MVLTRQDRENLIDALQEWDDCVGPKELEDDEVGLNADRFESLMRRLSSFEKERELLKALKYILHTVDCEPSASDSEIMDVINWDYVRHTVELAENT